MNKITFVNHSQFGYHIDYFQYCRHLKLEFEITYLCWDYTKKIIEEDGIRVLYIPRDGNIIKRNFRFLWTVIRHVRNNRTDILFVNYFQGCSFIPMLIKNIKKIHLDIRTGSVSKNKINRQVYNSILRFECNFFKSISIISDGLYKHLKIRKKVNILPLGANRINVVRQANYRLHLLYIGTLTNRNIENTLDGLHIFLKDTPNASIHYTIIGEGWKNEKMILNEKIIDLKLQRCVDIVGYIPHDELSKFFRIANAGVSYIPIVNYFNYQPPTKTFEYLMAGMPVIATKTYENKLIVDNSNGILVNDTPESVAIGIRKMYDIINFFNEFDIRKSVEWFEWAKIVDRMKESILK